MARPFPKKLIHLVDNIYATPNAWYDPKNRLRKRLPKLAKDINKLENELSLVGHKFILRKLPKDTLGLTYPTTLTSFIEPRRNRYNELLYTFLHEGIHLKQCIDGDLSWSREEMSLKWKGATYENIESINFENLKYYNKLPWEVDVLKKQGKIYTKLFGTIPKEYRGI